MCLSKVQTEFSLWFDSLLSHRHNILGIAVLWWSWKWRNSRVFAAQTQSLNQVLRSVLRDEALWRSSLFPNPVQHNPPTDTTADESAVQKAHLAVDGSWNPSIGRMGCAAVMKDTTGKWLSAISSSFGQGSAFAAEIMALELGLQHAQNNGFLHIACVTDCGQLVSVLQTGKDVHSYWDRDIIYRVQGLVVQFQSFSITLLDRNKNNTADTLAREAARTGAPVKVWAQPPSFVYASMYLDAIS